MSAVRNCHITLASARSCIGKLCWIRWADESGVEQIVLSPIHDVLYGPICGGYLISDVDAIRLDRVRSVDPLHGDQAGVMSLASHEVAADPPR